MGVAFLVFATIFMVVTGFVLSYLWNALMPAIFGLPTITFWQGLGLAVLSRILFGRVGGWGRMRKARFARGWSHLTPEERERFRSAMNERMRRKFGEKEGDTAEKG